MKSDNHLLYVDAENLHRCVLPQSLPYKDTMWTDPNIRTLEEWKEVKMELNEDEEYSYIYDCHMGYLK